VPSPIARELEVLNSKRAKRGQKGGGSPSLKARKLKTLSIKKVEKKENGH
jgi:hypothetical protein